MACKSGQDIFEDASLLFHSLFLHQNNLGRGRLWLAEGMI